MTTLQTIEISKYNARDQLRSLRRVMHERVESEYRDLERLYVAASGGARLIDIGDAFRRTGFHGNGWPKMGIARADKKRVEFSIGWGNGADGQSMRFDAAGDRRDTGGRSSSCVYVPLRMASPPVPNAQQIRETHASVPLVPPQVLDRQGAKLDLTRFHILFEAQWATTPRPADPFLLRRVSRYVFALVDQWDVTPIEALVMAQR